MKVKYHNLIWILILFGCSKHHQTQSPPTTLPKNDCDTTGVSYSGDIKTILSNNCYSCHSTSATSLGGLDLEDTTSLKNYLKMDFRGDGIYGSKLYHCILHSQYALPMPPTYTIDTCSLKKLRYWLSKGAPIL